MIRTLLSTTAVFAMISTGALAANTQSAQSDNDSVVFELEVQTVAPNAATGILVSNMIGKPVMSSDASDAKEIGDINDVIVSRDGTVQAVIVGVGGFLGIGEKDVAVDLSRLSFVAGEDERYVIVSDVARSELEDAAAFERPDYIPEWMTTSAVRDKMDEISKSAEKMYDTVRKEAIDPAKKRAEQVLNGWTADKTKVDSATVSKEQLIDTSVYTSEDNNIGEIDQVLVGSDGTIDAVVINVGGFLGLGEKPVAVAYDSLNLFETENGDLLVTAPYTEKELENAKAFEPADYKMDPASLTLGS
ncbi:MAG: PRC-barrel domain-containing protein [Rhodobacteraceae bacterium]|nr:PRC-barrel domain-containing protein [Paracoccaceae bacterium]